MTTYCPRCKNQLVNPIATDLEPLCGNCCDELDDELDERLSLEDESPPTDPIYEEGDAPF